LLSIAVEKMKTMSPWRLIWLTVLVAEVLTALMNTIMGYVWWGRFSLDLVLIGCVDALFVSLLAAGFVIHVMFALRDSQKHVETNIRKYNEELEMKVAQRTAELIKAQKMEAVGNLAGGIAHDFNNILTVISGECEAAIISTSKYDPLYPALCNMLNTSNRAAGLVRKLLQFSRRQNLEPVNINLNQTINDILGMLEKLIGEDIAIETVFADDLWTVKADRAGIEQMIINLAVNARDAMPKGGSFKVTTSNAALDKQLTSRAGNFVCITVSDTGYGMDSETAERIFDPFFTTKGEGKNTGLGLSVVQGIIEQHNGWITVESKPGFGTAFNIFLVASPGEAIDISAQTTITAPLQAGNGQRILLIEDDHDVRDMVSRILGHKGYAVFPASNAADAIDTFEKENREFNLVITDMILADEQGLEIVEQLHSTSPHLPVLICSGYMDYKSRWPVIEEKGYRFLAKPFTLVQLLEAVKEQTA